MGMTPREELDALWAAYDAVRDLDHLVREARQYEVPEEVKAAHTGIWAVTDRQLPGLLRDLIESAAARSKT